MNNGYKGMLRDRLLPSWNLALLWCKVKQRWIDIVYERNIKNISKELRSENCKFLTGHKNKHGVAGTFMRSVDPNGFLLGDNSEEYYMWINVDKWVKWFSKNQIYIYKELEDIMKTCYIFSNQVNILQHKFPNINVKLIEFMVKNKQIYYGRNQLFSKFTWVIYSSA